MCGINGFISNKPVNIHRDSFQRANDIIEHRGPDDQGMVFMNTNTNLSIPINNTAVLQNSGYKDTDFNIILGHRRLSILDLTSLGSQPMGNNNKSVWITFNGEIYNYIELREVLTGKGHTFRSNSDTEVIIKAYEEWGEQCVEYFNGMWSFCLVDLSKKKVFCSRDRFGVKPFYYYYDGTNFIFGSEIKQLLEYPFIKRYANERAIYEYLAFSAVEYCEETFFQDIKKLMQGHNLTINIENMLLDIKKYYNPKFSINNDISYDEAVSSYKNLFMDSVRLRLRSDVEVGSCLSGGLDSSSIVCVMHDILDGENKGGIQNTFSSHFNEKEANELEYMQEVINATGMRANFTEPTINDFLDDINKIVWHQDEPFGSTSIFAQWSVFKSVQENKVKVMLDGQGADEQLAGYIPLAYYYFNELESQKRYGKLFWEALKYVKSHPDINWTNMLPSSIRSKIGRFSRKAVNSPTQNWINPKLVENYKDNAIFPQYSKMKVFGENEYLNNILFQLTFYTNIQSLLHYEDRNSMAFSVESRVPFLDYRLVELLFSLPSEFKIRNGYTKSILRDSMKNVIPDKIRLRQSKLGFATPERTWQKTALREMMGRALDDDRIERFIIKEKALEYQEIVEKNNIQDPSFWRWINLHLWMEAYNVK